MIVTKTFNERVRESIMGKVEFNFKEVRSGVFTVDYCLNGEQLSAEEPAHSQEEAETQLWGRLSVVYSGKDCYLGKLKK